MTENFSWGLGAELDRIIDDNAKRAEEIARETGADAGSRTAFLVAQFAKLNAATALERLGELEKRLAALEGGAR